MKKLVMLLILIAGVGLAWTYVMKTEVESRYSLSELQRIADGANKSLPVMVDDITRLEKVSASEKVLEKHYTLVGTKASDVDATNLKEQLNKILIEKSCDNNQSIKLYKNGISEWFTYNDGSGTHIATIKIGRYDCKI